MQPRSALEAPQLWLSDLAGLCGAAWFEVLRVTKNAGFTGKTSTKTIEKPRFHPEF